MKTIKQIHLTDKQLQALSELRERLVASFEIETLTLYGSVSRGEEDKESDIDLLIITTNHMEREKRHQITDIAFDINLKYDTNFSTLVLDKKTWDNGEFSVFPLKEEILRDGIRL